MAAFTVIDHTEIGSGGAAYWEETGIPSTYDHLMILVSGRDSSAGAGRYGKMQFGDGSLDTGTNYSATNLLARTATPTSSRDTGAVQIPLYYISDDNDTADTFGTYKIWIPNYANTANFKQAFAQTSAENASTTGYTWSLGLIAGLWSSTDNIERIRITAGTGDWMQYSTFTLYGVTGA